MSESPWANSAPNEVSYTLKAAAGHDAPWVVFRAAHADALQALAADFFGFDVSNFDNAFEALVAIDAHAKALVAAAGIGATPMPSKYPPKTNQTGGSGRPQSASAAFPAVGAGVDTPAAAEEPQHPFQAVLDEIAGATSQADINSLYARSKKEFPGAFKDADVLKAAEQKVASF